MKRLRIPALLAALLGLAAVFTGGVSALTPPAGTLIINRCVANGYDVSGNALAAVFASATTPLAAGPRLSVVLSETPAVVLPGNNFTYTLDVLNTGNGSVSSTGASLYLPPEVSTSSLVISGGGVLDPPARTINWSIATLASGETAQFTVAAQLLSSVPNGAVFVSSAAASAPGGYYDSSVSSSTAGSASLLSLALSGPAFVTPGGLLTYTISYLNNGNATASSTRLTAPLPPLTAYSTSSSGGYLSGGNIVWDLGSIPAGSSGTVTYAVRVSTLAADGAVILNTVSIISSDSSASSSQLATEVADPSVVFTSTAAPSQVAPGGRITVTMDFTNDPTAALYGVTLTALLPEKTSFVSADNSGAYSAGQITWSLGDLLAGESRTVRMIVDALPGLSGGQLIISSAAAAATGMPVKLSYSSVSITTAAFSGSLIFTDQALAQVSVYRPGDTIYIEMLSPSANLNSGAVETATVTVACDTLGDTEVVTLTETAAGSGIFRGSLTSVSGPSAIGNGALGLIPDCSLVVARYDSSAPGGYFSAEAIVDPYGVVFNSVTGAPVAGAVVTIMDTASGNPAVLGVGQVNPFTTDAAGRFHFPFVPPGSYYLSVVPGAGYSYPTVLGAAAIAPGFYVSTGSKGELFTFSQTSPVLLDIPVDPGAAAFSVAKTCDRQEANTGDILYCSVSVTNIGGSPASALRLVDLLPHGFAYAKGTSRLDGTGISDPGLSGASRAVWTIASPAPGAARTVRYAMLLGADSERSDGVNRAYAEGTTLGAAFVSNTASFKVRTGGGVFTSRGTLIGRVFIDANSDGLYQEGEAGVENAEIYTEDGVRIKTDRLGKYHINSALPGSRVVRLDAALLPPGLEPEAINHRFAEDGVSQFADMDNGGLRKANFALLRSTAYYSGACASPSAPAPGTAQAAAETYEAALSSGPRALTILSPADGAALESRRAAVAVKFPSGSELKLYVNGLEIPGKKIGRRMLSLKNSAELYEFIGLELEKGNNAIKAEVYDQFGNKRGEALANVTAPGDAARVEIKLPPVLPQADGKSSFLAEALLLDENGQRLLYTGFLTAEVSAGGFAGKDVDSSAPGFQVLFEKGRALIALIAPEEPGPAVLKVRYNDEAAGTAEFVYKPFLRDMLVTGLADLRLGRSSAGGAGNGLKKVSFMEKGTYSNGRGAFFAKGRLWKELSLTASYDTAKEKDSSLFRQDEASPDSEARYPLYGDESALNRETYSSDKLFVKASVRGTNLLWGDYSTALLGTRLAQHQRTLTGAKLVSEAGPVKITAFAARTDYSRAVKAQRGKGTSGFYYLDVLPVVAGSERVVIETRDRQYPDRVLSRRLLALNSDYTADYELGAILFKEPVPSLDLDFNPVYVVVSYESSGGTRENSVYGGRAAVSAGPLSVGLTGAVEENHAGDFRLSGADAALKLPQGTTFKAEAAATRSLLDEGGVYTPRSGSAWTAAAETSPLNLFTLTAARTHAGKYFNNPSSLESRRGSDHFETGLRVPLTRTLTARGKYAEDRDTLNGGSVLSRTAGFEKKGKKYTGSLDLEDEESSKRYIPANLPGTRAPFDFSEGTQGRRTSAKAKLKTTLGRLGLSGEYSQDVRSGLYTTAQAGAEYKFAASKLYLREVYDRNHDTRETRSLAGIETALSGELTAVDEYRLKDGASGSALQQSMGLRNRHAFSKTLTGTAALEHLKTLSGNKRLADPDAFAVSGGLEYLPHDKLKLSGRAEYRTSDIADSWLGEFNSAFTLGSGWALLNQNRLVYEDRLGGEIRRSGRYSLGFSYRPEDTDTFNALLKTEYRDTRNTGPAQGGNLGAFIFSGEGVYQPSRALQLTGRYAGKFSKDGGFSAYTDLAAVKAFYDIGRRWDVGGEYRRLLSRNGGGQVSGGFAETGYLLGKDLWLSGGWSFDKFDADLAGDGYWGRGAYLRLRVKFDDTLFRRSDKDSDGDGVKDQLDKCPGVPACGEVDAQGCPPPAPAAAALEPAAEQPIPELPPSEPAPLIEDSDADGIPDAADTCPASAPCAVVDSSGCACPYQEPVLNLDMNFQSGKAVILGEYQEKLEAAAELLEHNPDISLEIQGHTDNSGKAEENLNLSAHRAENVRDTLIERYGADASRIKAAGYGDTRPLAGNDTPEGRRQNRRVVAVLHSIKAAPAEAGKCPARPESEKDERGCPKPVKAEPVESVKLDIVFETDKAIIRPEYEHEAAAIAELLKKDPTARAEIEGHTDNIGAASFNRELSEKRAQAVEDLLVTKYAVERARLEVRGYGDSRPIADNATREGRQKNRRVIVIITHQKE